MAIVAVERGATDAEGDFREPPLGLGEDAANLFLVGGKKMADFYHPFSLSCF